jgi:hypothetical protein
LSSAFLYVGIVAIWAFVLVPRWIRRSSSEGQLGRENLDADRVSHVDYFGWDDAAGEYRAAEYKSPEYAQREYPPTEFAGDPRSEYAAPDSTEEHVAPSPAAGMRPGHSRSKVLQARRRLLTILMLVATAAFACTALKLTPWWACLPPAGLLGLYLLLLREVSVVDAEQAHRRAAQEAKFRVARQREHGAAASDAQDSADVIDISARVGDQLYDQYADAAIRAVGD